MAVTWSGRWNHVRKVTERTGPFAHPDFEPSTETLQFLQEVCHILIIGAGGLGCELLKDLALLGIRNIDVIDMDTIDVSNLNRQFLFRIHAIGGGALLGIRNIDVIDMDTIDVSNLNRQFLFRPKDVGKTKAETAANFINQRIPGCNVTAHFAKIQDFDASFYRKFHIIVCGLDSIIARRWINGMLISMLNYEDGELDQSSIIPMVDGGTEGFKGNARVILPGMTACVDCTLDLYPPQVNFPLCTIAHTPRLPEHCIEYVRILLWPKEEPFGAGIAIDGDDPAHVSWILEKSQERANEYNISGITYRLTQGVVKRIIPAVASTNAVIAAACATEVFKLATSCCQPLNNYMNFTDIEGVYTYTFEAEKKDDCVACSQKPQNISFCESDKLQDILTYLLESTTYQMKSPSITTAINGKNRTLYMQSVKSIEEKTRANLKKSLAELELCNGQELYVADPTTPSSLTFILQMGTKME